MTCKGHVKLDIWDLFSVTYDDNHRKHKSITNIHFTYEALNQNNSCWVLPSVFSASNVIFKNKTAVKAMKIDKNDLRQYFIDDVN